MISKRFSAAANTYDRHAQPQLALAKAVMSMLPEMSPEQILEFGSGTGQLTRLIATRFPESQIVAVDIAEKMVDYSRDLFADRPQITWVVDDAQQYQPATTYPLVMSSSALHWTTDLEKTYRNINSCLAPEGIFGLGMMLNGTLSELHHLRAEIAPGKNPSRTLPSFENVQETLRNTGFTLLQSKRMEHRVIYENARAFLQAIHEQGVTGGSVSTGSAPLTRSELGELIKTYQDTYTADNGVYATYETTAFLLTK